MIKYIILIVVAGIILGFYFIDINDGTEDLVRPEKILSKREVIYDKETYAELAVLWKKYYEHFPSEDAYGNWMYAERYAGSEDFEKLLEKGLKKYSANPTLLYLASCKKHGMHNYSVGLNYLEKASSLDPTYMDPWFSLVIHYMDQGDEERTDLALYNILHEGVIAEEVMDYSYNMLIGLKENAILISNGDNDTYPGWILTRLLNIRDDVSIVNRNLLNTEWYLNYIVKHGVPAFITKEELTELQNSVNAPLSDSLIVRLIESAEAHKRPIYFASTLYITETLEPYKENWIDAGLVFLITPPEKSYSDELRHAVDTWLNDFRTGGIDGWRLAHAKDTDAGKILIRNYGYSLLVMSDSINKYLPEKRVDLYNWYQDHFEDHVEAKLKGHMESLWGHLDGVKVKEINCSIHGNH